MFHCHFATLHVRPTCQFLRLRTVIILHHLPRLHWDSSTAHPRQKKQPRIGEGSTLVRAVGGAQSQMVGIKGGPDMEKVDEPEVGNLALDPSALRPEHSYQQTLDVRPQPHRGLRNPGTLLVVYKEREKTMECYEPVSDVHTYIANTRPGNVAFDLPRGLLDHILKRAIQLSSMVDEIKEIVTGNRIWKGRNVGIGGVTAQDYAFSGVVLRRRRIQEGIRYVSPNRTSGARYRLGLAVSCHFFPCLYLESANPSRRRFIPMPSARFRIIVPYHQPISEQDARRRLQGRRPQCHFRASGRVEETMDAFIHHFKLFLRGLQSPAG
jgi:hypothetical protein